MAEKESKEETLHWADQIARDIKERVESNPVLKKIVAKHGYIVMDEKTPSGKIHIGSGRGWVIHDVIAKALRDLGLNAKFILSSDDIDPFDKMNSELPKEYEKYLGMPFRNMPSPVKGYKSFADYYFMQCVEKFEEFGIEAEIHSTGKWYDDGEFNKTIKIALDNHEKIKAIFEDLYKKPYDKLPFNPICEKCGKIGTTRAIEWDKEKELLRYKCEPNLVEWAKGCGHEGSISPYNGNGKFPWKVEWAAKWPTKNVVYEVAGKDHFTKLGSRDIAIRIADQVFKYPVPLPSTVTKKGTHKIYDIGKGYEFFNIGGKKMSTSKGQGIGFVDVTNYLPAHMARYLLVKSRPNSVLDFDPHGRNDLILLYERYDKTERIYFKTEKVDQKEYENNKRIYELSHVGKIPKKCPIQIPLTFAAIVIQAGLNEEGALNILKKTGHVPEEVKEEDSHLIMERLHDAKRWLEEFADDEYKFKLMDRLETEITEEQKNILKEIVAVLKKKQYSDVELHDMFYKICEKNNINIKDFFRTAYQVLINRDRGPKLAAFINAIGYEKVIELFEQAAK